MFHFHLFDNHEYDHDPLFADEKELPPSKEDLEELARRHDEDMQRMDAEYENVDNDFILDDYKSDE